MTNRGRRRTLAKKLLESGRITKKEYRDLCEKYDYYYSMLPSCSVINKKCWLPKIKEQYAEFNMYMTDGHKKKVK